VKLKNGTRIDAQKVIAKNNKLRVDDSVTYRKKTVSTFSNGKFIYGCIKKKSFAKLIYLGDINVYQTVSQSTTTSYGGGSNSTHTHTSVKDYIEKEGTGKLMFLDYKSVKKLIPRKDPGYQYLALYKKNRTIGNVVMAGGFAMFIGGAVIAGNSVNNSSSGKGEGAGFAVLLGGAGAMMTGFIMNGVNHLNLHRAIAKHNGIHID